MRTLASENRKGVVLPIASVGGLAGLYTSPIYIACKHGVVGFVKSMELMEKYEGIKVVTVGVPCRSGNSPCPSQPS